MKTIRIKTEGKFKTTDVIKGAVGQAPNGMNLTQMRSRIRVLDAIDKLKSGDKTLSLEDSDFNTLTEAINSQPWAIADRQLLAVIEGILAPEKA